MTICFLIRTFHRYRGGIESYTYQMAKALAQLGHSIHIVTKKGEFNFYKEEMGPNIQVHRIEFDEEPFKGSWMLDALVPLSDFRYSRAVWGKIQEINRKDKIDIVESSTFADGFSLIKKDFVLISRFHGSSGLLDSYFSGKLKGTFRKWLAWQMERRMFANSDALSSVSEDFAKLSLAIWQLSKRKVEVIPNAVDIKHFFPGDLNKRERSVLFVGRPEKNKGIGTVLAAMLSVLSNFPDVKFIFAGRGFEAWSDRLSNEFPKQNVAVLGQISTQELLKQYQNASIGIFPSVYEAGGLVAMEAMACGCAVVASNVGGLKETITDGHDGILIPPQNAEALADAIEKLLSDNMLRIRLAKNAVETIRTRFDITQVANEAEQFYQQAIEKKRLIKGGQVEHKLVY